MKRLLCCVVALGALSGCGSFMEKIVPSGTPKWETVAAAAEKIPRGTPRWVVKMKLGTPVASGPKEWHYLVYGKKMAEAHIYFDDKGRVTDVQTNTEKDFQGARVIRRVQ